MVERLCCQAQDFLSFGLSTSLFLRGLDLLCLVRLGARFNYLFYHVSLSNSLMYIIAIYSVCDVTTLKGFTILTTCTDSSAAKQLSRLPIWATFFIESSGTVFPPSRTRLLCLSFSYSKMFTLPDPQPQRDTFWDHICFSTC
jgi:hypothetical protein